MSYKVIKKDKDSQPNLWKAKAEALIALLAIEISNVRNLDKFDIVCELYYKYLSKRKTTLKKKICPRGERQKGQ